MSNTCRKIIFFPLLLIHSLTALSQDDPYRAEVGIQAGVGSYAGEVNSVASMDLMLNNLKNIQPQVGISLRYRFNTRMAVRLGYDKTSIKGAYHYYNGQSKEVATLDNSVHFIDLWGEYNFFDYNSNPHKRFSKKISPYLLLGVGGLIAPSQDKQKTIALYPSIPIGVGIKMKIRSRWNLNIQLTNHLLLSDNLEGNEKWNNPIPQTQNNILNNDLHTTIGIGLTYDFWTTNCDCEPDGYRRTKRRKRK